MGQVRSFRLPGCLLHPRDGIVVPVTQIRGRNAQVSGRISEDIGGRNSQRRG